MSKTLKKIWNFVSTVLVAVVVLLALLLAGACKMQYLSQDFSIKK